MSGLKVTSIEELKKFANGEIVELPGFVADKPFCVRLKRVSMLSLCKAGKIPNTLLVKANELFSGGVPKVANVGIKDEGMMEELFDIMTIICKESLVEPSYKELEENGIELTDEQQMAIFSYTQRGVQSLEPFRK